MRALVAFLSGICFIAATLTVQAWNKPTHMISAAIAYADLNEQNPAVITKIIQVLKKHPQYKSLWEGKLSQVSNEDRDLYLFTLAARWPDDVRNKYPEYDHHLWHYVNIPYRPGEAQGMIPEGESIIKAFPENLSTLNSTTSDDQARAVALCWVFHLIGDIHQPLHSIAIFTQQFPKGDEGGSIFYILPPNGKTISLHKLWDDLILGDKNDFREARNKATVLRNNADLKRANFAEQLAVKQFNDWAVEGYNLAIERAYYKGTLKGSTDKENGAQLPENYTKGAKETAERQIVLSGYRIGDAIVELFGK
jgi:hypothetical protein